MSTEPYKVRDLQATVLRIDPELRHRLMRDATVHGRSLNKEIELLLKDALQRIDAGGYEPPAHIRPATAREPGPGENGVVLSEPQRAMLEVFDRLPPEKQLALLSLFK